MAPPYSRQPCVFATASLSQDRARCPASRMTALGNMQPSQQMCWKARRRCAVLVPHPHCRRLARCPFFRSDRGAGNGGRSCRAIPSPSLSRRFARCENRWSRGAARASCFEGVVENRFVGPVEIFGQDAILGRVVAEREQQRVRHVRLKAESLGTVDQSRAAPAFSSSRASRPSRSRLRRPGARHNSSAMVGGFAETFPRSSRYCRSGSLAHSEGLAAESMRTIP